MKILEATSDDDAYESNEAEGIWTAGISMPHKPESLFRNSMDNIWSSKIECHGESKEDAEELRDAVLTAIKPPTTNTAAQDLAKIGELIRTQNNRITDQPIFIVQQKRRVYGLSNDYTDDFVWREPDGESVHDDAGKAALDAERAADGDDPIEWEMIGYIDQWDFVTACFTEQGCKDYIAIDGHNLYEPRIYASCSYRNNEFRVVRDYLTTLTQQQDSI